MPKQKFWDSLDALVEDLATVEVLTFTGEVSAVPVINAPSSGPASKTRLDWDKLIENLGTAPDSKVRLAAATLVRFDFDVVNFRAQGFSEGELAALMEIHEATLRSSLDARQALIGLVRSLLPG